MLWFRSLLALLGLVYEIVTCILCGAQIQKKKRDPLPDGWVWRRREPPECVCARCAP